MVRGKSRVIKIFEINKTCYVLTCVLLLKFGAKTPHFPQYPKNLTVTSATRRSRKPNRVDRCSNLHLMKINFYLSIFTLFVFISCDKDDISNDSDIFKEYSGTIRIIDKSNYSSSSLLDSEYYKYLKESEWESALSTISLKKVNDSTLIMQCTSPIKAFSETLIYKKDSINKNIILSTFESPFENRHLIINDGELNYKWLKGMYSGGSYQGYRYTIEGISITAFASK